MRNNPTTHVTPLAFWQSACGGPSLSKHDFQHVIDCPACESFAVALSDALDDIQKAFGPEIQRFPKRTSLIGFLT
jgi:hypothetical protein